MGLFAPDGVNDRQNRNSSDIVVNAGNRWLLCVNTALGTLYWVDPQANYANLIDLDG